MKNFGVTRIAITHATVAKVRTDVLSTIKLWVWYNMF